MIVLLVLAILLACAPAPATVRVAPPAVVLIVSDTTRADRGGAPKPTWWKDAREYTRAYAASNGTTASSVALLTGRLPASDDERRHPIGGEPPCEIPDDWRPGPMMQTAPADTWFTSLRTDQPVLARVYGGGSTTFIDRRGSPLLVAEALDTLDSAAAGRAQVYWFAGPHQPVWDVLAGPGNRSTLTEIEFVLQRRCGTLDAEHKAAFRLTYRSATEHALAGLAPVIGAARASGALVIFTSDHGEALGEDGRWGHTTDLHDAQIRVPLLVWGPGVESGTDDRPVPATCVGQTARAVLGEDTACDLRTGRLPSEPPVVGMMVGETWEERVIMPEPVAVAP